MPAADELEDFIRDHFRSVWSLELLLHLRRNGETAWTEAQLVDVLRASQAVITTSVQGLLAGGLIVVEEGGQARYAPASRDLEDRVRMIAELYAKRPDAVRRLIVLSTQSGLAAFADAFRLRRE